MFIQLDASLPDLIRQSMRRRRCMDHRVKPGGDEEEIHHLRTPLVGFATLNPPYVQIVGSTARDR
jgi:hypothetical protein